MLLPRLKPSAVSTVGSVVRVISCRNAGQTAHPKDPLQPFREINKLASQGNWDAINNSPELFHYGRGHREAKSVYAKIKTPEDAFANYGGQPYGPLIFLFSRVALFFGGIYVAFTIYEAVVPEQYRLHYKYAPKHHNEHH
uniref:Uncharacterized protein n=1 Tax=Panagrolaimus sp. JU765 TaxID=591449 RepID=A0AC34RD07_9BILA